MDHFIVHTVEKFLENIQANWHYILEIFMKKIVGSINDVIVLNFLN